MRGRLKGSASRGAEIAFGDYAIKATTRGFITSRQIESARRAMVRYIKRGGKIWIRVFPDKAYLKWHEYHQKLLGKLLR